jgi:hypothetical protein
MTTKPPEDPRITALRERSSGTRQNVPGTIIQKVQTARSYLTWLGAEPIDRKSVDRFFAWRREKGIAAGTLQNDFSNLQSLFNALDLKWPFSEHDRPRGDKNAPKQPTFKPDEVEYLINHHAEYSPAERLYLAISTTWACRCEALSLLDTYNSLRNKAGRWNEAENTLTIPGVKGSETVSHTIPEVLMPLFQDYRLEKRGTRGLIHMFHRIIDKAGMELPPDYGWHSFRRTISTAVLHSLVGDDKQLWAWSTGWSKEKIGREFYKSEMAGYYDHPEILDADPHWIDKKIYAVHPILKIWETALKLHPVIKKHWVESNEVVIENWSGEDIHLKLKGGMLESETVENDGCEHKPVGAEGLGPVLCGNAADAETTPGPVSFLPGKDDNQQEAAESPLDRVLRKLREANR